ncbi:unnamed protein product [Cyprideis torosa]|uniref:Uncharacterized protein n=1 Tax=Cyprideis torosa TaxID=163714 RepID=A0A7R8WKL3_9CRUS|nr:unnamed protein product [Cyprideis torosa]CAG0903283.1 unnamed protein product [Cyprideis torosa]
MWSYQSKPPITTKYECSITGKFKRGCIVSETSVNTIGRLSPNDTLRIQCDIIPFGEYSTTPPPALPCASHLMETRGRLFTSGVHSDVTLVVEDRKFPAHKSILAAQSPVFASMFEEAMLEKQIGEVKILDVRAEVMQELLRFMYTGDVKNIKKIGRVLLAATLDRKNFHGILVLADFYESSFLKDVLKKFVLKYPAILNDDNLTSEMMEMNSLLQQLRLEVKTVQETS